MKIKLASIVIIQAALREICEMDIVSQTSYWLGKFQNKIEPEFKDYNGQVSKLRDKYGKWKYRLEKEIFKDNKSIKETEILTLQGTEKQKHWAKSNGEKIESFEMDPQHTYWEPNSDEDGLAFREELEALDETEFEVEYKPIKLNRLVRKINGKEEEINIKPAILGILDGIIVDEEEKPSAA